MVVGLEPLVRKLCGGSEKIRSDHRAPGEQSDRQKKSMQQIYRWPKTGGCRNGFGIAGICHIFLSKEVSPEAVSQQVQMAELSIPGRVEKASSVPDQRYLYINLAQMRKSKFRSSPR